MDVRVLQYFLAVAKHGSVSKAAEFLNITQPPLSRQLRELEEELGTQLFVRECRKMTLTESGLILRDRAEEILELFQRARDEVHDVSENITGNVYIGSGDTEGMVLVAKAIRRLREQYPDTCYHLSSSNSIEILDQIDKGLLDFGVLIIPPDESKYASIRLPANDAWGLLMRKDSPLAACETVSQRNLRRLPLILPRTISDPAFNQWLAKGMKLQAVATYSTISGASVLVDAGVGYAVGIDRLGITHYNDSLCYRLLEPRMDIGIYLSWNRYRVLSKAAEAFLQEMKRF